MAGHLILAGVISAGTWLGDLAGCLMSDHLKTIALKEYINGIFLAKNVLSFHFIVGIIPLYHQGASDNSLKNAFG